MEEVSIVDGKNNSKHFFEKISEDSIKYKYTVDLNTGELIHSSICRKMLGKKFSRKVYSSVEVD